MKLPPAILAKTLARFDSLIADGCNILACAQDIPAVLEIGVGWEGNQTVVEPAYKKIDPEKFVEWRTKAVTLLALIIQRGHVHRDDAEELSAHAVSYESLQTAVSFLRGIKDDLENGFLDDIASAVESEIACDYMGQAERLLGEGHRGQFDHVPAAVLAGAVLERALRTLWEQQQQTIPQKASNGTHKTLGPLIDELKKSGVFNEAKAKQLRAWADIRNLAAHGEFQQFKRTDVEAMIAGTTNFLADYLR